MAAPAPAAMMSALTSTSLQQGQPGPYLPGCAVVDAIQLADLWPVLGKNLTPTCVVWLSVRDPEKLLVLSLCHSACMLLASTGQGQGGCAQPLTKDGGCSWWTLGLRAACNERLV